MKTYTLIIISVLFGLNYHVHSQEVTHNKDKKTETTRSKEERKAEHAEIRDKKELDNHRSKQEQVNQSQSDAKTEKSSPRKHVGPRDEKISKEKRQGSERAVNARAETRQRKIALENRIENNDHRIKHNKTRIQEAKKRIATLEKEGKLSPDEAKQKQAKLIRAEEKLKKMEQAVQRQKKAVKTYDNKINRKESGAKNP